MNPPPGPHQGSTKIVPPGGHFRKSPNRVTQKRGLTCKETTKLK